MNEENRETIDPREVVAVIVHYGDPRRTTRAVQNHWQLGTFSHIVVVANDLCQRPEGLREIPCTWLIPGRNIGFGGACQLGALSRPSEVYAFFNPHVTISKSSVLKCAEAFDLDDVGIVSPYIYHPGSGNPEVDWRNSHCKRTYSRFLRLPIQIPLGSEGDVGNSRHPELLDNDWATGGAIFCRNEIIRDVGWDGSYFLSFEDVDISLRAKKMGWRVVTVTSAIASHSGESTRNTAAAAYYAMRNSLWFARKYSGTQIQWTLTAYLFLLVCRILVADTVKARRPRRVRPALLGLLDGWRLWPHSAEALPDEPLWEQLKPRNHERSS